jgi:hypothetical protein
MTPTEQQPIIIGNYHEIGNTDFVGELFAWRMETTTEPTVTLRTTVHGIVVWLTEDELRTLLELVQDPE